MRWLQIRFWPSCTHVVVCGFQCDTLYTPLDPTDDDFRLPVHAVSTFIYHAFTSCYLSHFRLLFAKGQEAKTWCTWILLMQHSAIETCKLPRAYRLRHTLPALSSHRSHSDHSPPFVVSSVCLVTYFWRTVLRLSRACLHKSYPTPIQTGLPLPIIRNIIA